MLDARLHSIENRVIANGDDGDKPVNVPAQIAVNERIANNRKAGWGQCLAELVAVQKLNGNDIKPVYGIVTDGELWQFGKLTGDVFTRNETVLAISALNRVFGAIGYLMRTNGTPAENAKMV